VTTGSPVRILLVEDNPGDARLIQETLADSRGAAFDLETADRLATGLERLRSGGIDVVLLDLTLPDSGGAATFGAVNLAAPHIPTIVLTGLGDEALALQVVREGAQDYLVKGQADGEMLARAIRYAIERQHIRLELKRAEEAVRQLNEELEQRVRQRTAELEAANHELEAFTYSVSHDLRAPLRHVNGFVRILVDEFHDDLNAQAQHYLDRIEEGARRMGRLVDDLLNLARVGRQHPQPRATALGSVVREVISELGPELAGREIDWRVADLPEVRCDPGLLHVAFTNLLSNAVKYTRPRSRPVIEVGQTTRDGERAFFVKDNGVGFDMKYADKLFGVFQRLHRADEFEGTGVGLATVQRIVHKHGGRIWAEAELDRGAAFYFTLAAHAGAG